MDPLKQQQLTMPTVEVYQAIEEQILLNMAKQLKKHKSLLTEEDILSWQTQQLSMLGSLTQQNVITIAKHSEMAIDEVSKALEQAGFGVVNQFEGELQEAVQAGLIIAAPTAVASSVALADVLMSYQRQAKDTFNMVNTTMLSQSQQVYLDIINQTTGKVLAGTQTPKQALRETALKWAEKGIPSIVDKSGRKWSTEAYVNMVVRSTVNNVANDMQFARMDDYNVDLIEVSSHIGARPRCAPFQGKIYSRSGRSNKFPPLSSTSYGEAAGLKGVNCGHVFYPFIEGVSTQRYQPYDEMANEKAYKESQQQRKLEREIRKAKRQLSMMQVMGDDIGIKEAKKKVKDKQANMRAFINETERTRRYDREQIV